MIANLIGTSTEPHLISPPPSASKPTSAACFLASRHPTLSSLLDNPTRRLLFHPTCKFVVLCCAVSAFGQHQPVCVSGKTIRNCLVLLDFLSLYDVAPTCPAPKVGLAVKQLAKEQYYGPLRFSRSTK